MSTDTPEPAAATGDGDGVDTERIYREHGETINRLAERDDEIGALAQAVRDAATDGGEDDE